MEPNGYGLELVFYYLGGRSELFGVNAAAVPATLAQLNPMILFTQPQLLIKGSASVDVIPTHAITRIDLLGGTLPAWPYMQGAVDVKLVDTADFDAQFGTGAVVGENQPSQLGLTEFLLADGQRVIFSIRTASQQMVPDDFVRFSKGMLNTHCLHAGSPGGHTMINPKTIQRMSFRPGPPVLVNGALFAERL